MSKMISDRTCLPGMGLERVLYMSFMIVHCFLLMLVKAVSPVPNVLHFPQSGHENLPFISVSQSHPRQFTQGGERSTSESYPGTNSF